MLPASFTPAFLSQLELLQLHTKRAYLGTRHGGHRSLKRGHGIEFSDYRVYVPGDNPRDIDWAVFGRSDRLYVKRFQEEQALTVLIILDTSPSMAAVVEDKKWDRAREIALALAYIALLQQDGVAIAAPGYISTPALWGGRAIHELGKAVEKIELNKPIDFLEGVRRAANSVKFPGVAVVISDFLMPPSEVRQAMNMLRARNLDIKAIQVLGPNDLEPFPETSSMRAIDSESGEELELSLDDNSRREYRFLFEEHMEQVKDIFGQARINWTSAPSNEELSQFIFERMPKAGLLA